FFSSRRRHTRFSRDWSSDVCSSDLIMANLDIAEKRLPQDGRIALRVGGRAIDVRVSTLPTGHGERAVLRLLDKSAGFIELERLEIGRASCRGRVEGAGGAERSKESK